MIVWKKRRTCTVDLHIEKVRGKVSNAQLTLLLSRALAAQKVDMEFEVKPLGMLHLKMDQLKLIELNLPEGVIKAHVAGHINISGADIICDAGFSTVIKLRPTVANLQLVAPIAIDALQLDAVEAAKWRFLPIPKMVLNLLLKMSRTQLEQSLNKAVEINLANDSLGQLLQHSLEQVVPSELGLSLVQMALQQVLIQEGAILVSVAISAKLLQTSPALKVDLSCTGDQMHTAKILLDVHCNELSKILTANLDALNERIDLDGIGIAAVSVHERNGMLWATLQSSGILDQTVEIGAELILDVEDQFLQLDNVVIPVTKQGLLGKALVVAFRGKIKQLILDRSPIDLASLLDQIVAKGASVLEPTITLDLSPRHVQRLALSEGSVQLEIEGVLRLNVNTLVTLSSKIC